MFTWNQDLKKTQSHKQGIHIMPNKEEEYARKCIEIHEITMNTTGTNTDNTTMTFKSLWNARSNEQINPHTRSHKYTLDGSE